MAVAHAGTEPRRPWLFGPWVDGMLGLGGLYLVTFFLFAGFGSQIRSSQPMWLLPALLMLLSAPHYGATLMRVYQHREDRMQHRRYALWATIGLVAAFVVGVHSVLVASVLVTVYMTWSPYHYAAQNYGLSLMMLGRRGVRLDVPTRKAIQVIYVASFALVALVMHGSAGAQDYSLAGAGTGVRFLALGLPRLFQDVGVPLLLAAQIGALGFVLVRIRRSGVGFGQLLPLFGLVLIQALWFTIPLTLGHYGTTTGIEPIEFGMRIQYFVWIALAHATQYLWVTAYYARSSPDWPGGGRYWIKAVAAGQAVFVLPVVLFGPDTLGSLSMNGGLLILTAAVMNLHHFMLDGAIWKLRSKRVSRVLIDDQQTGTAEPTPSLLSLWTPRVVWSIAIVGAVIGVINITNRWVLLESGMERGDLAAVERSLDMLRWFGADEEGLRLHIARRALADGDMPRALVNFERSHALSPNVASLSGIAAIQQRMGQLPRALESIESALALHPDSGALHFRAGVLNRQLGDLERSQEHLRRAVELDPDLDEAKSELADVDRLLSRPRSG